MSPVSNQCDPSANLVGQFMTWSKENRSRNVSKLHPEVPKLLETIMELDYRHAVMHLANLLPVKKLI